MINEIAKRTGYYVKDGGIVYKGGVAKKGISVKRNKDDAVGIMVYVDDKDTIGDIVDMINDAVDEMLDDAPDFGNAKLDINNAFPCIRPVTDSKQIKRKFLDMEVYYRIAIIDDGNQISSVAVTQNVLDQLGVSARKLDEIAFNNLRREAHVIDMAEFFAGEDDSCCRFPDKPGLMNILSNKRKIHGAAVMADKEFMQEVAEWVGGDYYVLPSSIHEVLILPIDGKEGHESQMIDMVRDINATEIIRPEEVLSNNVYKYKAKESEFEIYD